MLRPRITPCLLVHQGGLVKTTQFARPVYVGDPINAVKIFNEKQADELIVLDIDASRERREPNVRLIEQFAIECRMPLCYGGGIKTVEHAKRITGLGVEKVAVGSAVMEDPALHSAMAREIGSQSVVAVFDVKRTGNAEYRVTTYNGRRETGVSLWQALQDVEGLGAGEIVVNSVDNDGVMQGYDLHLAARVRQATKLPMTVLGGAGSLAHISDLIAACGVVGAAAGSLFVFKGSKRAVLINYPSPSQKDELIRSALRPV
jgi:cyclase